LIKKRLLGDLLLLVTSLVVSIAVGEIFLRLTLSIPPTYEHIIKNLVDRPVRLFNANTSVLYDIKGLYEGADTVELNVSKSRFIEPEPTGPSKYRVLFLGGSSTEAINVPQAERWVALLNEPGYIGTYNAAQSGANTIDEYFTFLYLTTQGMKFDLVVLATNFNDMHWVRSFENIKRSFIVEGYKKGLHDYYDDKFRSKNFFKGLVEQSAIYRLTAGAFQQIRQLVSLRLPAIAATVSPYNVTQIQLEMRQFAMSGFADERRAADVTLMDRYPDLRDLKDKYRANAIHNIELLNVAVLGTGARLLVLTEGNSWMAPTSSFYQDLRIPRVMKSFEDLHEYHQLLNAIYLEAAKQAGALTYDLAAEVNPDSNGPQGGRYMYDDMHYTPEGCRLVAGFMRSVLHRLLESGTLE